MSVIDILLKSFDPQPPFCSAVILAAGSSQRMGADKILMELGGMPVIARTLLAFQKSDCVSEIVVVTASERIGKVSDICRDYGITKISRVVCGGRTRAESALAGVMQCDRRAKLIAIHDGARPFATQELIRRTVYDASKNRASAPAVRPTDTVRILDADGKAVSTPDRKNVALMQTPQIFDADIIKGALTNAVVSDAAITDDCFAVEAMGFKISIVDGEDDNIKLTTVRDIRIAEQIIEKRGQEDEDWPRI